MLYSLQALTVTVAGLVACAGLVRTPSPDVTERSPVFCEAGQALDSSYAREIVFPDTLRIVRDTMLLSTRIDTSAAFASGHDWFREAEPIIFGSIRYFRFGGIIEAHGATETERGRTWVRVMERDGVPLYAYLPHVSEPRTILAPVGLPCRFMAYVHQEGVR